MKTRLIPHPADISLSAATYIEQQALFRSLADSSPVPICIRMEECLVYSNRGAVDFFSASSAYALRNMQFADFVHPEDVERFNKFFFENWESKGFRSTGPLRFLRLDGTAIRAEITAIFMRIEGTPAWMVILKQLAGKSEEIDSIHGRAAFMETLIDSIPNPIFFKDVNGRYIGCNEHFSRAILGLDRDQIIGRTVFQLPGIIPEELAQIYFCQDKKLFDEPGVQIYESMARCADGMRRNFIFYKSTFNNSANQLAGLVGVMVDITELRQAEKELASYQTHLRSLSSRLTLAEEQDRRRIAVSLHEQIGQVLAASKLKLGQLRRNLSSSKLVTAMDEIRELIDKTIQDTRKIAFELSPPLLHELGLKAAIEWLCETLHQQHGVNIRVKDDGKAKRLDDAVRLLLFKATRELLFNIVHHAKAASAQVSIRTEDRNVRIEVIDDGVGFEEEQIKQLYNKPKGYGLFTIKERMNHLGGTMSIVSEPEKGCRVTLISPMTYPER
jgi:PAS domain S-box-containing protein